MDDSGSGKPLLKSSATFQNPALTPPAIPTADGATVQLSIWHKTCNHAHAYGLSCANYERLIERAKAACERCGQQTHRLSIDHDHEIGDWAVRGLVCPRCNTHLNFVDRGEKPMDEATWNYIARAFHADRYGVPARLGPFTTVGLGDLCGGDVSVLLGLGRRWQVLHSNVASKGLSFEHPDLAACAGADDYRQVLWLIRQLRQAENAARIEDHERERTMA